MSPSKRPPLDEVLALFHATVAAEGITTGPGNAGGTSIVDAALALSGANSFFSMLMVLYPGQPRLVDSMDITGFTNGTGEVTLSTAYKGVTAAIPAGVPYKIVTFRFVPAEVAAIEAKLDLATPGGTFSYLDAGGEQTVFTFTPTKDTILHTIWLDLFTLTQNSTIRLKHQIDGATYRTFETFNWTTGMDDGVYFRNIAVMAARPIQVTMQEVADEGANRAVPYYYVYEERA